MITMNGADVDSLYGQTLEMMRKQKGDLPRLGMKVLTLVSHAKRPLLMEELTWALSVVDPEKRYIYTRDLPSQEAVLGSCLGRVPNSPTGQVLEVGLDCPVLVDVDDWTRLTWVVRSGLDWSQTSLDKRWQRVRMAPKPTLSKS